LCVVLSEVNARREHAVAAVAEARATQAGENRRTGWKDWHPEAGTQSPTPGDEVTGRARAPLTKIETIAELEARPEITGWRDAQGKVTLVWNALRALIKQRAVDKDGYLIGGAKRSLTPVQEEEANEERSTRVHTLLDDSDDEDDEELLAGVHASAVEP
jgi:hypothetical protein